MIHPDACAYIQEHSRAQEVIDQFQMALMTGEVRFQTTRQSGLAATRRRCRRW